MKCVIRIQNKILGAHCNYKRPSRLSLPVSMAKRSKASTVYDCLNIKIAGLNLAQGMDVCLRVSVLCCPVFWEMPCVGLIPQPRSPTKCLWIEKSTKEGQGLVRTVEAS
jgi:hypothetical protein